MKNKQIILNLYVNQSAKRYADFMGIDKVPQFKIIEKKISLSDANRKGFGSFESHHYELTTGIHSLEVWSDIYQPQLHAEYLLFHEFTHILDTERYVRKDKIKNVMYRGFTEYHAGQIDLLKILGGKRVDEHYSFSMEQRLESVGNPKTVEEFVDAAHDTATSLINREDFPADVETLSITIGLIFNYWGRRSICRMYAVDYAEKVDNATIEKLIGSERYKALDELTYGWLDEVQIKRMAESYFELILSKMKEYSL